MGLEIDHVFVVCRNGAPELEPLLHLGFTEGAANVHAGQGTACRRLFFENAFLELIWLQDRREAAAPAIAGTHLAERCDPDSGWSPFGLCFRPAPGGPFQLPFQTWDYRPPDLPAGLSIPIGMNASRSEEPLVFGLSFNRRPDQYPEDRRQPLRHASGARALTRLEFHLPAVDLSDTMRAVADTGLVSIQHPAAFLLEVELDLARQGKTADLRPTLPLVLRW